MIRKMFVHPGAGTPYERADAAMNPTDHTLSATLRHFCRSHSTPAEIAR
jgi:hypothetical protein